MTACCRLQWALGSAVSAGAEPLLSAVTSPASVGKQPCLQTWPAPAVVVQEGSASRETAAAWDLRQPCADPAAQQRPRSHVVARRLRPHPSSMSIFTTHRSANIREALGVPNATNQPHSLDRQYRPSNLKFKTQVRSIRDLCIDLI